MNNKEKLINNDVDILKEIQDNPELKEVYEWLLKMQEQTKRENIKLWWREYYYQLDQDFDKLPKINWKSTFELPETKLKNKQVVEAQNDYVLAINWKKYLDLPKMTREEALKTANKEWINKHYDVLPRQYVEHMWYNLIQNNENILKKVLPSNFKEKAQDLVDKTMEKIGWKMNIMWRSKRVFSWYWRR